MPSPYTKGAQDDDDDHFTIFLLNIQISREMGCMEGFGGAADAGAFEDPEAVVTIVLENAGGGSSNGGPVVRRILDHIILAEDYQSEPIK